LKIEQLSRRMRPNVAVLCSADYQFVRQMKLRQQNRADVGIDRTRNVLGEPVEADGDVCRVAAVHRVEAAVFGAEVDWNGVAAAEQNGMVVVQTSSNRAVPVENGEHRRSGFGGRCGGCSGGPRTGSCGGHLQIRRGGLFAHQAHPSTGLVDRQVEETGSRQAPGHGVVPRVPENAEDLFAPDQSVGLETRLEREDRFVF